MGLCVPPEACWLAEELSKIVKLWAASCEQGAS